MRKEIVILTMSLKNGEYCVAGIDSENGEWVRLVSDDDETHGALTNDDVRYKNGQLCRPLDVVSVEIIRDYPSEYQPENVLIDTNDWWQKIGEISLEDLLALHPPERHFDLLGNKFPYITTMKIADVGHSLILVKVSNLHITHPKPRSTKADFTYNGYRYENMSVTDPDFFSSDFGTDEAILVMSLPDAPYLEKRYYKFIAKVFPID